MQPSRRNSPGLKGRRGQMADNSTVAGRVLQVLVQMDALSVDQLEAMHAEGLEDVQAGRVLVENGAISPAQLADVLEDELGYPRVDLESYTPDEDALEMVPAALARRRTFLPLFEIEGTLTIAIGDPCDIFDLDVIGSELGVQVDAVLADGPAVQVALDVHYPMQTPAPQEMVSLPGDEPAVEIGDFYGLVEGGSGEAPPAPAYAESDTSAVEDGAQTPVEVPTAANEAVPDAGHTVDLDVLAVADETRVAVLVTEILEQAVERGATRIHLLPYKSDFFLVFRIEGRLERVGSAPLSMQQALIAGFKSYVRLASVAPHRPAQGRMHADIDGKTVVLTTSIVPTVSGQRLVIGIAPMRPQPKSLAELGLAEAEERALGAMLERGRGLMLVAGPVTGGRSTTYYSLLQQAAMAGRTVYSVERSIEYEIPAVAQVLVTPGEPIGSAAYFSAGMQQDTDVMAIDALQTVEDVHLAIEAAGMGKLVIATFAAGDVVSAVRRLLTMGAEPVSLASALTLGVGQRVLRTNCPNCSVEVHSPLVELIPGVQPGTTAKRGSGCPNCRKSGFAGVTGLFEVLPFTEAVRAVVARDGSASELTAAARAAGMRPMIASGVTLVRDGVVSPEELDRVLRYS